MEQPRIGPGAVDDCRHCGREVELVDGGRRWRHTHTDTPTGTRHQLCGDGPEMATPAHVIVAPWSPDQVASINAFQQSGALDRFACRVDSGHGALLAGPEGWRCEVCDYRQLWAFVFMADGSWREQQGPGGMR